VVRRDSAWQAPELRLTTLQRVAQQFAAQVPWAQRLAPQRDSARPLAVRLAQPP